MQLARNATSPLTSTRIRKTFLDFFCGDKGHTFVRSSPVVPYGDPSLAFVNAGMNQFKSVLLGTGQPPADRVANSQKCVRVGGKHNDLAEVGADGTHHTFFEMLGNWSFGDYYKTEACEWSWELLTSVYGLDPTLLHVTYFGGDELLRLPPDYETRDIWLKIGVPPNRIEPKGAKDNFWEMGDTGPCGVCTEIHYLPSMLELWNLVFVEYNRESTGILEKLSRKHVDTGMGFERLVSVLQGKSSNYDSDLFTPIFSAISLATNRPHYSGSYNNLDTAYRILADHTRMLTICLADGFLPDQEGKLRGIIRRALTVSRDVFGLEEKLLGELSSVVADILSDAYPELHQNLNKVKHVINHEAELLRCLRQERLTEWHDLCEKDPKLSQLAVNECPNLIPAYLKLKSLIKPGDKILEPSLAWNMCETYGVPSHLTGQLADIFGLAFDFAELEMEITRSKIASRKNFENKPKGNFLSTTVIQELSDFNIPCTDDRSKYFFNEFTADQSANIVAILIDGDLVDFASYDLLAVPNIQIGIILDRTNMYSEAGGQESDTGVITVNDSLVLKVNEVLNSAGYVVHFVTPLKLTETGLSIHQECVVKINRERRTALMNNHTATHILNAALRNIFTIVEQRSSRVSEDKLCFDFSLYRENFTTDCLKRIEEIARHVIRHGVGVKRRSIANRELAVIDSLTVLPGETYHHEKIHVIEINSGYFLSREPCCGTHAANTSHLQDLVIIGSKSLSSSVKSIRAVTGDNAKIARMNQTEFQSQFQALEKKCESILQQTDPILVEKFDAKLVKFSSEIRDTELVGFLAAEEILENVENLRAKLKQSARGVLRTSMESEMKEVVAKNKQPFLVHYLKCSSELDKLPLQKASRVCSGLPSMLFASDGELVKARCCVPKEYVDETFSAEIWMKSVLNALAANGSPPKGQDPRLVFNMKGKKINRNQVDSALRIAREFYKQTHPDC